MALRRPKFKLRTKIIAWSFVPTAIILLLVALTIYYAYQQGTEDLVIKRDEEFTRLSASEVSSSFGDYVDRLTALARLEDIHGGNPQRQQAALGDNTNQLIFFDAGVYLLNNLGALVAAHPYNPELIGEDWSNRSFFKGMVRLTVATLFFSNIEPEGPNGEKVITIAVPILGGKGEFKGVAAGMFRLDPASLSPFYGTLLKLRIGRSGKAYLVDGNNTVIFATESNRIGSQLSDHPVSKQALQGQVGAVRTRSVDGRDIVAGFAPVPRTNWTLIVEESWSELTRSSRGYQQFLLLLLVLGVVIPTAVVMFGVRRITGPVTDFIAAAQRIADGDFSQPITVTTEDELEELADQFNTMAVRLEESYETLELRVAQRTQELSALNSIASVVSRSLDLDQILPDALTKTIEVLGMDAGAVFRLEPETGVLTCVAQQDLSESMINLAEHLSLESSIILQVVQTRQPAARLITDYPLGSVRATLEKDDWQTIVSIPLLAQEKVLGAMNIVSHLPVRLASEDLAVPASIGQQIGVAMDNARLYNQTVEYARQMEIERQAAEEARAQAEAANAAKSDFLANVSHELRTPLVSIFGFARLVQKRLEERIFPWLPADDKTQRAVNQIHENLDIILAEGQRLTTLINHLLDLEKIESGKMDWNLRPLSCAEVVRKAAAATASLFDGGSLSLVVDVPDGMSQVNGDMDKLIQVVINLISNAVKFTSEGTVTVRAQESDHEVVVSVIDQGMGIAPADQALLFEKFSQVGDTLTDKPQGTGLGLAISKEIVEHHGGRIWVESKPGEGSTFSFALPVYTGSDRFDEA